MPLALTDATPGPALTTTPKPHTPPHTPNSNTYNAGIAAGAALGALVLPLAGVRGIFLVGGLLSVGACAVLLGGRLLSGSPLQRSPGRCSVGGLR
ncbi:hypothetical protein [Streptomyces sp. NPDC026666]|uniref:hypothetical protein n=1 Tax=Streptomyces sp. NPDC026666 TaxID=3154799 RepID=UPI0034514C06